MANNANLELLLRIIASVDGLKDVEGLQGAVEGLDPALSNLAERARDALNPMNGLAESSRNFGESVKQATQPLSDLAATALKVSAVAAALATALGGAVYQEAQKFESAQLGLQKVLGGTQEELEIYGEKLNALALEFGVSSNALNESMAAFVQAGFSADEAINLVTQSLKLKVAGDLEAGQSSEYLVKMLKGFGAQAAESARLVDVLNAVSNTYATDVQQLAEGMSRVAPIAKTMGLSFEETAGVLTPMIESFGSGAEAAEAFKTGILKLIDDSKPVKEALQSIGVSQTDLSGKLRSGKDILNDVMLAFQTADQSQKLFLTSQLVGIDQAPRMIEVFNGLNTILGVQETGLKAAGSAQAEVNIRLQSAETIANRTAESFRQLAVALGTNYRDEVKGVVDATGAMARAFLEAEKAGSMDGLFAAVKPQLEAVENLFRQMAKNLPAAFAQLDFSPLTSAITDLGGEVSDAFKAFMGSIDLTTVDGLRQLLQYLADSMAALLRFTAGALEQMQPFFEALGAGARFAAENADSIARLAGEVAGFSLTVNQLLPLLADFLGSTFSIIGTVTEAAFKIGLLVGAIKLLNLAGISVLPMLGQLAAAIGGMSVGTATLTAAFAGFPGVLLGVTAAAGATGYALGNVGIALTEAVAPSFSLGSAIYDLAEALGLENTEADKARIIQKHLTQAREAETAATQAAEKAAREKALADERVAKAAEDARVAALAAVEANDRLRDSFQAAGLVWDEATGELVRVGDAMKGIAPASLAVRNALNDLGIDYAQFSNAVSTGSEKVVQSFKKITEDVTANAPIIATALRAAVSKTETIGDLEAIRGAFLKYAETGKLSASEVAAGNRLLSDQFVKLSQEQSPIIKNYEDMAKESSEYVNEIQNVVDAENDGVRAEIELAKAKGHTIEAQRLTRELAIKEAEGSAKVARAKEAEQKIEAELANAKLQQVKALFDKNQASQQELDLAVAVAQKELAEAAAAGVNAEAKEVLAQKVRALNGAKAGATDATDENAKATAENTEAQETNKKTVESAIVLYKGLLAALDGARNRMSELSETAGAYFEMVLQGTLNQYGLMGAFQSSGQAMNAYLNALEGAAGDTGELAKFESAHAQASAAVGRLRQDMNTTVNMMDTFATAIELAEAKTRQAFYEQAADAERLRLAIEEMTESGIINTNKLAVATQSAGQDFKLLDEQDLAGLNAALEEANDRLREMQEETQAAQDRLAELNAEIAAERGDSATADRLKLQLEQQQAIAEVTAAIELARNQNNRELITLYEEQKRKLEELYALREKNLEADIKTRDTTAANNRSTTTSSGGSNASNTTGRTYNVNLNANGRTLAATTATDPTDFLAALERAQRTAA